MTDLSTHFWKSWEKVVLRGWRHPRSHLCHRCLQPLKTTFSKSVWKCSRGVLKWLKHLFKVFLAVLDLLQHFWTVFEGFRLMSCNRAGYGSRSENTPPKNFGRQTWNFFLVIPKHVWVWTALQHTFKLLVFLHFIGADRTGLRPSFRLNGGS